MSLTKIVNGVEVPLSAEEIADFEARAAAHEAAKAIVPVPKSITPRQCRLILSQQRLLDSVEEMIAQQDRATQITWEYALEFRRDDPLLNQLAVNLNLKKEQIDQFFIEAAKL